MDIISDEGKDSTSHRYKYNNLISKNGLEDVYAPLSDYLNY